VIFGAMALYTGYEFFIAYDPANFQETDDE
jgi:hypothetical protein